MDEIKVGVGLPTNGYVKTETAGSLAELCTKGIPLQVFLSKGSMLHSMRTNLVLMALKNKCSHILFVDSDMKLHPDSLPILLGHKKDIVSFNYSAKALPREPVVKLLGANGERVVGEIPKELFECSAVGFGCTLIDLRIFEFIPLPWFVFGYLDDGVSAVGEDVYFCEKARANGFEVWCDPTVRTIHVGDYEY